MAYGKRPVWQWILIYLVVGGLIYWAVWYFGLRGKGYNYNPGTKNSSTQLYR